MDSEQVNIEKNEPNPSASNSLAPKIVLVVAGLLVAWVALSIFQTQTDDIGTSKDLDYEQAVAAELADKCATPEDYTDEEWLEHMGHHPGRYAECFGEEAESVAYKNISPDELEILLASFEDDEDIALIDTHIPEQAHIPGTDAFVPFNEIADRLDELPDDKDAPIVLYCRSGNMSETASKELVELGYSNVYNLEGGTNAWRAGGRDVVSETL